MKKSDFKVEARSNGYAIYYKGELLCGVQEGGDTFASIMNMIRRIAYWKSLAEDVVDAIVMGKARSEIYITMSLIETQQGARNAG